MEFSGNPYTLLTAYSLSHTLDKHCFKSMNNCGAQATRGAVANRLPPGAKQFPPTASHSMLVQAQYYYYY
eukprot:3080880-Rhodomonas_salina.2